MISQYNGITGASDWIQVLLNGSLVLSLATLGILAVGFGLLTGRLSIRHGMATAIGCFIMIGATNIARAILQTQSGSPAENRISENEASPSPMQSKVVQKSADPYAGSSLVPN